MVLMKPSAAVPLYEACPESRPSHPSSRKGFLSKIFLGLALLLLVGCAGASIAPEEELSSPPAVDAEAANPGLLELSQVLSPNTAAGSGAPAEALAQQADNPGAGRPVRPSNIPSVEKAGEKSEPASPAPTVAHKVAGDTSSGVPKSEPESATAVKENLTAVGSQPSPEPLQAPAAGPEESSADSSPQITLPPAPAFTLTSASGEPVSLETYRGESNVVLVFFRGFW